MSHFVEEDNEQWKNFIYKVPSKERLIAHLAKLFTLPNIKYILLENGTLLSFNPEYFELKNITLEEHLRNCLNKCIGSSTNYNDMNYISNIDDFAVIQHGLQSWGLTVIFDKSQNMCTNDLDLCLKSRKILDADRNNFKVILMN